jgi:hypothetical protein
MEESLPAISIGAIGPIDAVIEIEIGSGPRRKRAAMPEGAQP